MGMVEAGLDTACKLTQTRSDAYALALLFYGKQQEEPTGFSQKGYQAILEEQLQDEIQFFVDIYEQEKFKEQVEFPPLMKALTWLYKYDPANYLLSVDLVDTLFTEYPPKDEAQAQ